MQDSVIPLAVASSFVVEPASFLHPSRLLNRCCINVSHVLKPFSHVSIDECWLKVRLEVSGYCTLSGFWFLDPFYVYLDAHTQVHVVDEGSGPSAICFSITQID